VRGDYLQPQTRSRGAGIALAERLRSEPLAGRSAAGLHEAHRHLPRRRSLVFLVSDFHFALDRLEPLFDSLAQHDVVPVVLWQPVEFALGAAHGLAQVREPESGAVRWLWWRPALRERWREAHDVRRAALTKFFQARRLAPMFIEGAFDADAVTRHFLA